MKKVVFPLLFMLYFAQGIPAGLMAYALPALMRDAGVSLRVIGAVNLLALPWMLKFLWAPFLDGIVHARESTIAQHSWKNYHTRLKFIALLQVVVMLGLLVLSWCTLQDLMGRFVLVFVMLGVVMNSLMASHDILTDGLTVRVLKEADKGMGNSFQVAGYKVGMTLAGSVVLFLVASEHWRVAVLLLAILLGVLSAGLLWLSRVARLGEMAEMAEILETSETPEAPETPENPIVPVKVSTSAQVLWGFVSQPYMWIWLMVVVSYKLGDALSSSMVTAAFVDAGFNLALIAQAKSSAVIVGIIGAVLGGVLYKYTSVLFSVLCAGTLQSLALLLYALCVVKQVDYGWWLTALLVEQGMDTLSTVVLFAVMMRACRYAFAGSDYTLQASVFLVVTGAVKVLSGVVAEQVGYTVLFVLSGTVFVLPLCLIVLLYTLRWPVLRGGDTVGFVAINRQ